MVLLGEGKNSVAYYSFAPPKGLIVFVHGLGGKSVSTWGDFRILVQNYSEFKEYDVVFYGYSSMNAGVGSNGLLFFRNMERFAVPPKNFLGIDRQSPADYSNIIIVAHSLGAVVTRRALLFANTAGASWLSKCKMFLLAPAHRGSYVQGLVDDLIPDPFKGFLSAVKYFKPAFKDLQFDSVAISSLVEDTEFALSKGGGFTKAAIVLWSMNDRVVLNQPFCSDTIPELEPSKDHRKVCELVHTSYMRPFLELKKLM